MNLSPHFDPWPARFERGWETALARRAAKRRVACGFTNDVDVVIHLDDDARHVLESIPPSLPPGEMPPRIREPGDVVSALLHHMPRGTGDVLAIESPEMSDWMGAHFHGAYQLGGTGAQAANTLSYLGFETLLHLTVLSPVDLGVFDPSGRILVARPEGLMPLPQAVRPDDRPIFHFVLEYGVGDRLALRVGGVEVIAARANRIIMGHDPLNAALPIDPVWVRAVADPDSRVGSVLLSGYTDSHDAGLQRERLDETAAHVAGWRAERPDLLLHLELASVVDPLLLRPILDRLAPRVDSLGLNEDEARLIAAEYGLPAPRTAEGRLSILQTVRERLGVRRVGLHTQDWCLALTQGDPTVERDALLFAALVAGTRARLGRWPTPADVGDTLRTGRPCAAAIDLEAEFSPRLGLDAGVAPFAGGWVVWTPALSVPTPAGTVGLGDSFTGALLAALG